MGKFIKIIIGFFVVILVLVVALLVLPFVIDLNHFKPQIQAAVSKKLKANIDFSSIRLTVLSGIGVELKDVSIQNTDAMFDKTKLLDVKKIQLKTQLSPLMEGKIVENVELLNPTIHLIKNGEANNITALFPQEKVEPAQGQVGGSSSEKKVDSGEKEQAKDKSQKTNSLKTVDVKIDKGQADLLKKVLLESFEIKNANITVDDMVTKSPISVQNFNFKISNLGIGKQIHFDASTNLDLKKDDLKVSGPIVFNLVTQTDLEEGRWKQSDFHGKFNFDKLKVEKKDLVTKPDTVALHMSFDGQAHPTESKKLASQIKLTGVLGKSETTFTINESSLEPLIYNGNLDVKDVSIEELYHLAQPKKNTPLEGLVNMQLDFNGKSPDMASVAKTVNAKGLVKFISGKFHGEDFLTLAQEKLEKESFVQNSKIPGLKQGVGKLSSIKLGKNKELDLKDAKVPIEIKNGFVMFKTSNSISQGDLSVDAKVGLDNSLDGTGQFVASKDTSDFLVKQSDLLALLYNKDGNLELNLLLSGDATNPDFKIDTKPLMENLKKNSPNLLKGKVGQELHKAINKDENVKKAVEKAQDLLKSKGVDLKKFGF